MKISIIGTRGYPYVYSGYETFVSELAPRLVQEGYEVTVYCHKGLFNEYPASVNGVNLVYLPAIESKILSQFSHSLLATLHSLFQKVDMVLYVNTANGPFGILTLLFRRRTAINTDGLEWRRPKWQGLGAKYFYFASWLSTKVFDIVISDSDQMAEIYKNQFNCQSLTIAYGANIGYSTDTSAIENLGLEKNSYYLVVGRLIPDNNADVIIRGYRESCAMKKLVIVGDVPYEDSYADHIRSICNDRVLLTGYVRNGNFLRELYCNAYAYIHGHEFGGTNPTLLKALAYGCCILALDTVFNREVLNDEQYGLYFHKTTESVKSKIEWLEKNTTQVSIYQAKARDRITEKYTWEQITYQYHQMFMREHTRGRLR